MGGFQFCCAARFGRKSKAHGSDNTYGNGIRGVVVRRSGFVAGERNEIPYVWTGRLYVASMLVLNVTAFGIYNLFGRFGVFHWFALASLATIIAGMIPVWFLRRSKNWISPHYQFMAWSYAGLLAATSNEIFAHVPALNGIAGKAPWVPWACIAAIFVAAIAAIPFMEARFVAGMRQPATSDGG